MAIITISRGSYSRGKEVAEKLAQELGYEGLSRDVLLKASEQFNIQEIKLVRAIHDAPSVLDRFTYGKDRYVAFFRAALLKHFRKDNVVYHGLAGHFFVPEIPHVLKVRIIADFEDRVREEMRREQISAEEARYILAKDDAERRKWSLHLYGVDTWDPSLYDMVIHIKNMGVDDAVSCILHAVQQPCFRTTPEAQQMLNDLALSAQVEAILIKEFPKMKADAKDGKVFVSVKASFNEAQATTEKVQQLAANVEGVKSVHVNIVPVVIRD